MSMLAVCLCMLGGELYPLLCIRDFLFLFSLFIHQEELVYHPMIVQSVCQKGECYMVNLIQVLSISLQCDDI